MPIFPANLTSPCCDVNEKRVQILMFRRNNRLGSKQTLKPCSQELLRSQMLLNQSFLKELLKIDINVGNLKCCTSFGRFHLKL